MEPELEQRLDRIEQGVRQIHDALNYLYIVGGIVLLVILWRVW